MQFTPSYLLQRGFLCSVRLQIQKVINFIFALHLRQYIYFSNYLNLLNYKIAVLKNRKIYVYSKCIVRVTQFLNGAESYVFEVYVFSKQALNVICFLNATSDL